MKNYNYNTSNHSTIQIAPNPTGKEKFHLTTEEHQVKEIKKLINAGYRIKDGKFTKDPRILN